MEELPHYDIPLKTYKGTAYKYQMTEQFIRNTLFPVIRAGMGIEIPPVEIVREDIERLKYIGNQQSILPIIWAGLKSQNIPEEWLQAPDQGRLNCIYQYVIRDHSLQQIGNALENAAIPYIPLKGAVLRMLYPEPWMRTSSDIDILVHEADLEKAVEVIENETDFKMDKRNYHDVSMCSRKLCLELHFSLKENMENIDGLLSRVWEYAEPIHGSCYELAPEFLVFHNLAHMSYHMVHGGLGIRPYLDLWLLKEKTCFDEASLRQMCEECGILKFYDISCELMGVWMYGEKHSELTANLERYCLSGGVFGSDANGANQRDHRGSAYLFHRLFVKREVIEEMYPGARRKPYMLPLYQVKRWLRLSDPRKRKSAIDEMRRTNAVSRETIESFDALLKSMGL